MAESSLFSRAGFAKLCWKGKHERKVSLRTVYNNIRLEDGPDREVVPQAKYKSNRIKVRAVPNPSDGAMDWACHQCIWFVISSPV